MTISEIVRAAAEEHLSYGEYVHKYNPSGESEIPSLPTFPTRACACCGADISGKGKLAKYCFECLRKRRNSRQNELYAKKKAQKKSETK